jgi:signal transduction histidine kinase
VIEVSDRGAGVPASLKLEIFEKFRSSEAGGGGARRGYGLGLYLVKLVAEAHGGTVSAADREGGGTTFTLTLPAHASIGALPDAVCR